jgi:hypothetical protein
MCGLAVRSSGQEAEFGPPGSDQDRGMLIHQAQQVKQIAFCERDAALGGAAISGTQMNEDGTTAPAHRRIIVMAHDQQQVVQVVIPPEPFMAEPARQLTGLLYCAESGSSHQPSSGEMAWTGSAVSAAEQPVGTIQNMAQWPDTGRRCAIAFALQCAYAGGSDAAVERQVAHLRHSPVGVERRVTYHHLMKICVFP